MAAHNGHLAVLEYFASITKLPEEFQKLIKK
jgi:hypothetical protein